jgi:hypothetical protein
MMRPRQFATVVALCGTAALVAWDAPRFGFDPFGSGNTARPTSDFDPPPAAAIDTLGQAVTSDPDSTVHASVAGGPAAETPVVEAATSDPDCTEPAIVLAGTSAAEAPVVEAASLDSRPTQPDETPVQFQARACAEATRSDPDSTEHSFVSTGAPAAETPVAEAPVVASHPTATSNPDSTEHIPALPAASAAEMPVVEAPLVDSHPTRAPEKPIRLVSAFPSSAGNDYPRPAVPRFETLKDCFAAEVCIDDYLWSLYERTPKFDTNKLTERIKKTVKKKGKTRTVITTITKYVVGDFTWKDPIAAQRAGMSVKDYVIGGMDRSFKLKLYRALRAMEAAGLMAGITSAFRDDYRQAIATGNKAASDSSYHGGSRRGGYGHGLAADLVSIKGETRMERYAASDELWKWIDAHEKELAIGRPYRDRDPPHVGPIDGKEYVAKRALANVKARLKTKSAQMAKSKTKKPGLAARDDPATKRATPEKSPKVSNLETRSTVER